MLLRPGIWRENRQKVFHADIRYGIGRIELYVRVVVDLIRKKPTGHILFEQVPATNTVKILIFDTEFHTVEGSIGKTAVVWGV